MSLFATTAVAAALLPFCPQDPPATPPAGSDIAAATEAYLQPLVASHIFTGSVLMVRDGQVAVARGYGRADVGRAVDNTPDTAFKLMSVTKPLTAIAVMTLRQAGELEITDTLGQHLSPCPQSWRKVTLRNLLSHTSGIANVESGWVKLARSTGQRGIEIWPQFAAQMADQRLNAAPGTVPAYNNVNFILLGLVIEKVSGQAYADYMTQAVLQPARMTRTGFDDGRLYDGLAIGYDRGPGGALEATEQDMSMIQAAGGIYSTIRDLYRLDRALHANQLLHQPTLLLMHEPVTQWYACGWQLSRVMGHSCFHHSGGANGYVADYLRFPQEDACVVVLSNLSDAPATKISRDLAAILFEQPHEQPQAVGTAALEACAGTYQGNRSGRTFVVRRSGDALVSFQIYDDDDLCAGKLLIPLSQHVFSLTSADGARLRFGDDGARFERLGEETPLARLSLDPHAWDGITGKYTVEPELGDTVSVTEENGVFSLRVEGEWPERLELVPLADDLAIALAGETFGTKLRWLAGTDGTIAGFRWRRADGTEFTGRALR